MGSMGTTIIVEQTDARMMTSLSNDICIGDAE